LRETRLLESVVPVAEEGEAYLAMVEGATPSDQRVMLSMWTAA